MTKALLLAASLGLSISHVSACDFHKSAKVDATIVASAATSGTQSMSTPEPTVPDDQPVVEEEAE